MYLCTVASVCMHEEVLNILWYAGGNWDGSLSSATVFEITCFKNHDHYLKTLNFTPRPPFNSYFH